MNKSSVTVCLLSGTFCLSSLLPLAAGAAPSEEAGRPTQAVPANATGGASASRPGGQPTVPSAAQPGVQNQKTAQTAGKVEKEKSATDVMADVQRVYDQTKDYRAEFRQILTSETYGRKQIFDGTVYIKKPGKMRWEYARPEKKLFVSDASVLWMYEPEDNQAYRQAFADAHWPGVIPFLMGTGRLSSEFDASFVDKPGNYGAPGDSVLRLVPKQASSRFREVILDIDAKTSEIKQTFWDDTQGNRNQMTFVKPQANSRLADSLFRWSPPSGTRIIELGPMD